MRTGTRLTTFLLLMTCLVACDPRAQTTSPIPLAAAATPAPVTPPAAEPSTSAADAGLAIAIAREDADRSVREQTLRVQRRLREQEREWARVRAAAQQGNRNERCMAGQKMRRVANGWEQAGTC